MLLFVCFFSSVWTVCLSIFVGIEDFYTWSCTGRDERNCAADLWGEKEAWRLHELGPPLESNRLPFFSAENLGLHLQCQLHSFRRRRPASHLTKACLLEAVFSPKIKPHPLPSANSRGTVAFTNLSLVHISFSWLDYSMHENDMKEKVLHLDRCRRVGEWQTEGIPFGTEADCVGSPRWRMKPDIGTVSDSLGCSLWARRWMEDMMDQGKLCSLSSARTKCYSEKELPYLARVGTTFHCHIWGDAA